MNPYVHHTPGRLRIRNPLLKRNPLEADRATSESGGVKNGYSTQLDCVIQAFAARPPNAR